MIVFLSDFSRCQHGVYKIAKKLRVPMKIDFDNLNKEAIQFKNNTCAYTL